MLIPWSSNFSRAAFNASVPAATDPCLCCEVWVMICKVLKFPVNLSSLALFPLFIKHLRCWKQGRPRVPTSRALKARMQPPHAEACGGSQRAMEQWLANADCSSIGNSDLAKGPQLPTFEYAALE